VTVVFEDGTDIYFARQLVNERLQGARSQLPPGLTPEMAAAVHTQLASRMREGYSTTFLTAMRQAGYEVYLWKLSFKDGKDDMLAKVVLNKDGQVAGFWIN